MSTTETVPRSSVPPADAGDRVFCLGAPAGFLRGWPETAKL